MTDLTMDGREIVGPWTVAARLACWDEPGDGVITIHRRGGAAFKLYAHRFPIGWRCSAIETADMSLSAKAAARRVLRRLP